MILAVSTLQDPYCLIPDYQLFGARACVTALEYPGIFRDHVYSICIYSFDSNPYAGSSPTPTPLKNGKEKWQSTIN